MITWSPTLDVTPNQRYTYVIRGTLERYGISAEFEFQVEALPCVASLSVQNIYLEDMSRLWGQQPDEQLFGIQLNSNYIVQTPNCGYDYRLDAKRVFSDSGMIDEGPLPVEVGFNPDAAAFYLSKCNAYGDLSDYDSDCNDGTRPYFIQHKIALCVTLDDPLNTSDFVTFDVKIEGCSFDSLDFVGHQTTFDYLIYNPAQQLPLPISIDQTYDLCPVSCQLIPLNAAVMPSYIFDDFVSTVTPNPSFIDKVFTIIASTNSVALDNTQLRVELTCVSDLASEQSKVDGTASASTQIVLNLVDQCYFADITPATRDDVTIPLYQESNLDLVQASTNVTNCPTVVNYINPLSSTADVPMTINIGLGPLVTGSIGDRLNTEPALKENVGEYTLQIISCQRYGSNGMEICVNGAPFTITVVDPCATTEIKSAIFPDVMQRPRLRV